MLSQPSAPPSQPTQQNERPPSFSEESRLEQPEHGLGVAGEYLQVGLHERRPGLHQVVTDAALAGGGGFVERRLTSETDNNDVTEATAHISAGWGQLDGTHVSLSVMSR